MEIIRDFYNCRQRYYQKRKDFILLNLKKKQDILQNKLKFINAVVNKQIPVTEMKKNELEKNLLDLNYLKVEDTFDYLTRIPIYNFTKDNVQKIDDNLLEMTTNINTINCTTICQMYNKDLDEVSKYF